MLITNNGILSMRFIVFRLNSVQPTRTPWHEATATLIDSNSYFDFVNNHRHFPIFPWLDAFMNALSFFCCVLSPSFVPYVLVHNSGYFSANFPLLVPFLTMSNDGPFFSCFYLLVILLYPCDFYFHQIKLITSAPSLRPDSILLGGMSFFWGVCALSPCPPFKCLAN